MQTIQRLRREAAEVREQNRLLRSTSANHIEARHEFCGLPNNKGMQELNLTDPVVGNAGKMTKGAIIASNQVSFEFMHIL